MRAWLDTRVDQAGRDRTSLLPPAIVSGDAALDLGWGQVHLDRKAPGPRPEHCHAGCLQVMIPLTPVRWTQSWHDGVGCTRRITETGLFFFVAPAGMPSEMLGTVEVFDTEAATWSTRQPMPTPRNHHGLAHVNGTIYAVGGRVGSCYSNGFSSNVWINEAYDIVTDTWAMRAPMPTARSGIGVEVVAGAVHVMGGEGWVEDFGGVFRTHETYDPSTDRWTKRVRMPTPRHGFATGTIDGRIHAVSGVNNAGGAGTLSVVEVNEVWEP